MRNLFRDDMLLFKWFLLGVLCIILLPSLGIWYLAEYHGFFQGPRWTMMSDISAYVLCALMAYSFILHPLVRLIRRARKRHQQHSG